MKRWQLVLMRSILAIIAVFLLLSFARYQIHHDRVEKVNDMMDAALPEGGYYAGSLREYERAKIYEDTDGWHTVTVALADEGENPPPLVRQAMVLNTGSEAVQAVAGIAGYEESERELVVLLAHEEPRRWDMVRLEIGGTVFSRAFSSRKHSQKDVSTPLSNLGEERSITISFFANPEKDGDDGLPHGSTNPAEVIAGLSFDEEGLEPYFSFTADLSPLLEAEGL